VVLGGTFYLSCTIFSISQNGNLLYQSFTYASVVLLSIVLGRYIPAIFARGAGRIIYTVFLNGAGILIGCAILMLLRIITPELAGSIIAIAVSSIIAFFLLGTLSPMFLSDRRLRIR
jgi:hypothetical protein